MDADAPENDGGHEDHDTATRMVHGSVLDGGRSRASLTAVVTPLTSAYDIS